MIKRTRRYEQAAARLVLEGLPDVSAGHDPDAIGIVTGWTLDLVGRPQLEGRRDHLQALVAVVLPYARHLLSGVRAARGNPGDPIRIEPLDAGHQLQLHSSRPEVPPLQIVLDDGELADLVRCLDALCHDSRVAVAFEASADAPLPRRELQERVPLSQRLSAPVLGLGSAAAVAVLGLLIPPPPVPGPAESAAPVPETPQTRQTSPGKDPPGAPEG
jgi:hypothetical protein